MVGVNSYREGLSRWKDRHSLPAETMNQMSENAIYAEGVVLEQIEEILYRVSLPNGKKILAHLSKPLTLEGKRYEVGEVLWLEMTPFDFEQARILGTLAQASEA